jgi:hypothetical protein
MRAVSQCIVLYPELLDFHATRIVDMQKGFPSRFPRIFATALITTLALSMLSAGSAFAQTSTTKATMPDSAKALVGTWEGTYTSDHAPAGAMKAVFAQDSVIKLTSFSLAMDNTMQTLETGHFSFTSDEISWTEDLMGMSCQTTAVLKNGQLKGAIVCGHGSVAFTLSKR